MGEQSGNPRRTMFSRLEHHENEPLMTSSEHRISASLRRSIDGQLEDGLRSLEEQATDLMREIAAEVWRASGDDMRPEQERIISLLSRDQAIRTLITSNDERFQALALRAARVEDSMNEVAETGRGSRDAIEGSLAAIREIADSPTLHGIEGVRNQLEQVEHHIAAALATMQERDRAIVETVTHQVRSHGQALTEETAKVIGAIDAYVQTGAEAMGTLSRRVEEHAETFATHDGTIGQTVADRVATELAPLAQQLDMLSEQTGMHARDREQVHAAIERLIEARVMGIAQLVRADSEALRQHMEADSSELRQQMEAGSEGLRELVQNDAEALRQVVQTDVEALRQVVQTDVEALRQHMEVGSEGLRQQMEIDSGSTRQLIEERTEVQVDTIRETVDWRMAAFAERVDEKLGSVATEVAAKVSEAVAVAVGETVERIDVGVGAIDGIDTMLAEGQAAVEERLRAHIDDRMSAVARLIRSDNQALASALREQEPVTPSEPLDAELVRQTLRAIKELQAGLADDMQSTVDSKLRTISDQLHKETQSTTESMVKVAEVLGEKIDRLTVHVDEGVGNDMQIVIDRMSDAIQAMSATRRSA